MMAKWSFNKREREKSLFYNQLLGRGAVQICWIQHGHALEQTIGSVPAQEVSGKNLPHALETTEEATISKSMSRSRNTCAKDPASGRDVLVAFARGVRLVRSRLVPGAFRPVGCSRSARTSRRSPSTLPRVGGLTDRVKRHFLCEIPYLVMDFQ